MDPKAALDPFDYALEAIPTDDPEARLAHPRPGRLLRRTCRAGTVVFTGDLTLQGRRPHDPLPLDARATRPASSRSTCPEERVVFTGDTIFSGCQTWLMTSNVDQWLEALERIRALPDVDHVVPGHGPVVTLDYLADAAGGAADAGRPPSPTPSPRAGRARRRSRGSGSTTASARSTSGRAT